jgi:Erv1 / Alr family
LKKKLQKRFCFYNFLKKKFKKRKKKMSNGFCSSTLSPWWFVLHMDSMNYPLLPSRKQRETTHQWLMLTLNRVPCDACSNVESILSQLEYDPKIDLKDRESYVRFLWRFHNALNERLGKSMYSLQELLDYYDVLRATSCTKEVCTISKRWEPHCSVVVQLKKNQHFS